MAEADYRLMTEATGQRIAIALENLAGFGDYLTTSDVVNDLTRQDTDKPAAQKEAFDLNTALTPIKSSVQRLATSGASSFAIEGSASSWFCGLLICNINGVGNGAVFVSVAGAGSITLTSINGDVANYVSASISGNTLTFSSINGKTFGKACWFGC